MGVLYTHYIVPEDRTLRPEPRKVAQLIDSLIDGGYVPRPEPGFVDEPVSTRWHRKEARYYAGFDKLMPQRVAPPPPSSFLKRVILKLGPSRSVRRTLYRDQGVALQIPIPNDGVGLLNQSDVVVKWGHLVGCVPPFAFAGTHNPAVWIAIQLCGDFVDQSTEEEWQPKCSCGTRLSYETSSGFELMRVHRICPACRRHYRPQDEIIPIENGYGTSEDVPGGAMYRFCIEIYCEKNGGELQGENGHPIQVDGRFIDMCRHALEVELHEFSMYS